MRTPAASRGGQTLTYAICWSGARGPDLFLATGPSLDLLELGRRKVGQRGVGPGGWLRGHRPLEGQCLGGWGSQSRRQLEVRSTCSTNEVEVSQHKSRKINSFAVHQEADLQYRFFLNCSLHLHGLTRRLRRRRWGFTGLWCGPRHGDGDSGGDRWACPSSFGLGPGGGCGRTIGGWYKYDSASRQHITTSK
jgi:hypothetical protein